MRLGWVVGLFVFVNGWFVEFFFFFSSSFGWVSFDGLFGLLCVKY